MLLSIFGWAPGTQGIKAAMAVGPVGEPGPGKSLSTED